VGTALHQLNEMILERRDTRKILRQRLGLMMMKRILLKKNRRNLNNVKEDRLELKIDKILILRKTLPNPKTSTSTSINLSKRSPRARRLQKPRMVKTNLVRVMVDSRRTPKKSLNMRRTISLIALPIQHSKNALEDQDNPIEVAEVEEAEAVETGIIQIEVDTEEEEVVGEEVTGIMREEEDIEEEVVGITRMRTRVKGGPQGVRGEVVVDIKVIMLLAIEETLMEET
jgi:hypothetical protein